MRSSESADGTQLVHVGRQPIFDVHGDVIAYELLFRGSMAAVAAGRQDTYATSTVMINAFTEFGINEVAGDRFCFINLTREFLAGELPLPFGPAQVVLEVLETVEMDDEVIAGITKLAEAGYRIALDDFVWGAGHEQLFSLASYVKLDLLDGDLSHLDEVVAAVRQFPNIQLVAERLETDEQVALADHYGMELRQGYALSRPQVLTASSLSPSRLRRLELVNALSAPDADMPRIVSIIASDPALSLRVLRASNSVAAGHANRVSSVRQAVVMVGLKHIRQWAMLMVLDDVGGATEEHMLGVLTRARLCENVAQWFGAAPDAAFMAGVITGVAAVLGIPPAAMTEQFPLAPAVAAALTTGSGRLGQVLRAVDSYERGELGTFDLAPQYMDAVRWSTRALDASNRLAAA
ncbi:histidine kinase [Paractinoplanes abujensis]|uniref:EAL and modified HD-GYP domain-containing signal transduction protein n=1 Tax=Paractinoplanes abujensis TaxID=882441 RepID=A0A7W7G2R5_9ACTN|nr:HDOD domain-containing protein [Actinoplanes abujensis]MBB4695558.1 EAL and modified HD-GYP domain-containing signal transduction protein [Actinoplanes abujensis]GID23142.1 histidine kinase [Actinoplanes abujensis]